MAHSVSFPLYTPDGCRINFTIDPDIPFTQAHVDVVGGIYNLLRVSGLSIHEPGLGAQEHSEDIHYVVRREKLNDDGSSTPVIDLYGGGELTYRFLAVYLNTPADIAAFESATGLTLDSLPVFPSDAPLQRGAQPQRDAQFMRPLVQPVPAIYKLNPDWTPEEKKKPKRLFQRWGVVSRPPVNIELARKNLGAGEKRRIGGDDTKATPSVENSPPVAPAKGIPETKVGIGSIYMQWLKRKNGYEYVLRDVDNKPFAQLYEGKLLRDAGVDVDALKLAANGKAMSFEPTSPLVARLWDGKVVSIEHIGG